MNRPTCPTCGKPADRDAARIWCAHHRQGHEPPTPEKFTTYQCPPDWEFGWVTDPEYFEDTDDEITVTRRRYQLVDEAQVTWHPTTMLCRDCGGEGDLVAADGETLIPCERCDSDGRDPLAGTWTQENVDGPTS